MIGSIKHVFGIMARANTAVPDTCALIFINHAPAEGTCTVYLEVYRNLFFCSCCSNWLQTLWLCSVLQQRNNHTHTHSERGLWMVRHVTWFKSFHAWDMMVTCSSVYSQLTHKEGSLKSSKIYILEWSYIVSEFFLFNSLEDRTISGVNGSTCLKH